MLVLHLTENGSGVVDYVDPIGWYAPTLNIVEYFLMKIADSIFKRFPKLPCNLLFYNNLVRLSVGMTFDGQFYWIDNIFLKGFEIDFAF